MTRLWNDTIAEHRREVREAILDTTAELVAQHGLRSLTMSQIAQQTGIGRATLYKYFSGVDTILIAWHERQIGGHLTQLAAIAGREDGAGARLQAVLEAYALIVHEHRSEQAALIHQGEHINRAQQHLSHLIEDLLSEAAGSRDVRDDVACDELATYCLHALAAASGLPSKAAVCRLVGVTHAGLRPRA
jgi:AcrR family transcriptional regulator